MDFFQSQRLANLRLRTRLKAVRTARFRRLLHESLEIRTLLDSEGLLPPLLDGTVPLT